MANTTNLDLVKPAGTDKALVSVLNANSDKIDTWAGSTNQALSHYYDTNGALKTLNGIDVRTISEAGRYYCIGCTNLPGGTGYGYLDVYVYNANYRRLLFHEASYDAMYTTRLQNGTWQSWQQLARTVGRTPYTPTFSSQSSGFAVSNVLFAYSVVGNLMFISGRFNITNIGNNPNNNTFDISLPAGYSCSDFVGSAGKITLNKQGVDITHLSIRQGVNVIYVQSGAGSTSVLSLIGTGYIMLDATVMLD